MEHDHILCLLFMQGIITIFLISVLGIKNQ